MATVKLKGERSAAVPAAMSEDQLPGCCGIAVLHDARVLHAHIYLSAPLRITPESFKLGVQQVLKEMADEYDGEINDEGPPGMVLYSLSQHQADMAPPLVDLGFQPLPGFINPRSGNLVTLYWKIICQPAPPDQPKQRKKKAASF